MFSLLNPDTKKYILTICIFVIIHDNWHFSLGIGGLSTCTVQLTRVHQSFFQGFDSKFLRNILSKSLASIFSVAKATRHSQMSVRSSIHLSLTKTPQNQFFNINTTFNFHFATFKLFSLFLFCVR